MNRADVTVGQTVIIRPTQERAIVQTVSPGGTVQVKLDRKRGGWYTTSAEELDPEPTQQELR